uniref:Uncharacterized protein n=1 Tax=Hyaloperonospora arabidopsidis (strain Emoy2) TaxID=559515 RepID=M4BL44_HYAAE
MGTCVGGLRGPFVSKPDTICNSRSETCNHHGRLTGLLFFVGNKVYFLWLTLHR